MHELSIASSILNATIEHASGIGRIEEVHVSVGCLMMVNVEQLRFGFEILAKGTIAENARFVTEIGRAKLKCREGHETFIEVEDLSMESVLALGRCRVCNAPTEILEGRNLVLTRIIGE